MCSLQCKAQKERTLPPKVRAFPFCQSSDAIVPVYTLWVVVSQRRSAWNAPPSQAGAHLTLQVRSADYHRRLYACRSTNHARTPTRTRECPDETPASPSAPTRTVAGRRRGQQGPGRRSSAVEAYRLPPEGGSPGSLAGRCSSLSGQSRVPETSHTSGRASDSPAEGTDLLRRSGRWAAGLKGLGDRARDRRYAARLVSLRTGTPCAGNAAGRAREVRQAAGGQLQALVLGSSLLRRRRDRERRQT